MLTKIYFQWIIRTSHLYLVHVLILSLCVYDFSKYDLGILTSQSLFRVNPFTEGDWCTGSQQEI